MRTKYNVSKDTPSRTHNGIVFDSAIEMKYYRDIVLPQTENGEIAKYELQRKYILQPKFIHNNKTVQPIVYVADFFIRYKDGKEIVVDIKGCADSIAKLKRKMFRYQYPETDYRWLCYSAIVGGWCDYEYVELQRKERKRNKTKNGG